MEKDAMMSVIVILAVIVFAALIAISYVASTSIRTQGGTTSTIGATNQLSITASGTASNTSSQGQLYITVNGTGQTSAAAVSNLSIALNKFNSTIYKYVNGNLSMITTSYYNVYKNYNNYPCVYPSGGGAVIPCKVSNSTNSTASNYTAQESITVKIPSISNVSAVLLATSQIPGVYVTSAQPILSDAQISALRTAALSLALANATSQAKALIGLNNTIYNTNISVNNYYFYPYYAAGGAVSASASNGTGSSAPITVGPQFYGGTNKVTESITAVFYYGKKQ